MSCDGQLYCDATEVLVDVPAVQVRGLIEAHPSPIELPPNYCFELTPSKEPVARTCRPRDQYCGRGNYTCVNKWRDQGYILVGDPNSNELWWTKSEMPFTLSAYETDAGVSLVGRSNNTVLPYNDTHLCGIIRLMDDRLVLTTDGDLFLIDEGVEWIVPDTEYCLKYYTEDGPPEAADLRAFLCTNAKPPVSFLFWVKTLTVVCLVLTLIVYANCLISGMPTACSTWHASSCTSTSV